MNKVVSSLFIILAIALIIYNITMLNFDHLFEGDSIIALISIVASLCAIVILIIFLMSKKIQEKIENS